MTARLKLITNAYGLLFLTIAATICVLANWIVTSSYFLQKPEVFAFAITFDIALGIPLLYYFFAVRRKLVPAFTLLPIFILSLVLASAILPEAQRAYLDPLKHALPFVELIVLGFIVIKMRAIWQSYRTARPHAFYATEAFFASCKRVMGELPGLSFIVTEMLLLYFSFAGWFKKYEQLHPEAMTFYYHRKSGYGAILCAIIMIFVVETLALHLLLQKWSTLLAWVFTGLSGYSLLWIVGDYHAMRLQPIILHKNTLHLRLGLHWRVNLQLDQIAAIIKFHPREQRRSEYLQLTSFGAPRLLLNLKEPTRVTGLFGIKRTVTQIGLTIDDEQLFVTSLKAQMS